MRKTITNRGILILFVMLFTLSAVHADEFPGRKLYPAVDVIELEDLMVRFDEVTVVDVRSRYEYDTLHVKGADHIALSSSDFASNVQELLNETGKPIVFYCNGRTCEKSYKAASKAAEGGVEGTMAFDAGILDWTRAYPEQAVLLGEGPVDPQRLLSKAKFKEHLLPPSEFGRRIGNDTLVIDARDRFQRDAVGLFVGREVRVPFDDKKGWVKQVAKAKRHGKTMLIYDAVGKQVRWLQYFLEDQGVRSYYFMDKGAKGYYANMMENI